MRIAVVAPSAPIPVEAAPRVTALAAAEYPGVELVFHPQCFSSHGHFAGEDAVRAAAFVEAANDPAFAALWFAGGGYGSCRIAEEVLAALEPAAREKTYLGYSDAGFMLAGLYRAGFPHLAHGPMPKDIRRVGGEDAVRRSLSWMVARSPDALEPSVAEGAEAPFAAFNITVLSQLLGTPLEPDLSGHTLMLEEVSEHLYRTDRALFHLTGNPALRRVRGIRFGRCSDIPPNDRAFGAEPEDVIRYWCARSGIPFLGPADIGHDAGNRVVPFGAPDPN